MKTAAERRYDVATHVSRTASISNSSAIDGNATLIEDAMKGAKNELNMATIRADLFSV
jgi:formiminotetrahydrofolate cyclodeaminase